MFYDLSKTDIQSRLTVAARRATLDFLSNFKNVTCSLLLLLAHLASSDMEEPYDLTWQEAEVQMVLIMACPLRRVPDLFTKRDHHSHIIVKGLSFSCCHMDSL